MKKILLNLFAILLTFSNAFAEEIIDSYTPPTPQQSNTWGAGAQATPIDDYSVLLIFMGILIATALYFYKNKIQLKFK